ncbi:hypothetical protein [Roseibium sp.]|uniref:hypothetical protein n=1 Tax=Roseibium sp. TaxID=1936156 RepID=UPI003B518A70
MITALAGFCGFLAGTALLGPQFLNAAAGITCPPHRVMITNRSSNEIKLLDIRWLNSDGIAWIFDNMDPLSIGAGADWQKTVSLTGLSAPETSVKARYQILGGSRLEDEFTSEQTVSSCHSDRHSTLRIVDKRR